MKYISHRGNINGPFNELENNPDYIDEALKLGYDVELDIWYLGDKLYLGHDEPTYEITFHWLQERVTNLWVHCKNIESVEFLRQFDWVHYFWHQNDDITLTSFNFLWTYPGKQLMNSSICVMPENNNEIITQDIYGICSDYIKKYKNEKNNIPM